MFSEVWPKVFHHRNGYVTPFIVLLQNGLEWNMIIIKEKEV